MARRYWGPEVEAKTLRETLHMDNVFREVSKAEIQDLVRFVREDLDDLAVLLMFSVFEATVRQQTLDEIDQDVDPSSHHLVIKKAIADARETVEHGSFGRLTESFKSLDADAKTQIDQVRHYRNWVAHGRRGPVKNNINPQSALARLENFLGLLDRDPAGPPRATEEDL